MCNALRNDKKELEYIDMLKSNKVSGIILCTRSGHLLDSLRNLPVVTLERAISDQIPNILCDNFQGGILATKELVEKGCRHLAIISGSEEVKLPADERASAFVQVCKEAGLSHHVYGTS
ncbi:MAG TPA: LacI family transcriptional regulator, partial [Sphaerochaeta sp.]|nr:LacI family transcriptional regulator [Sphaerochaeta sp.]